MVSPVQVLTVKAIDGDRGINSDIRWEDEGFTEKNAIVFSKGFSA